MKNWKQLAQFGLVAGSVALLAACGPMWACGDDCDDVEEDLVYIEVDKDGNGNVDRIIVEERDERIHHGEAYKR